MIYTPFIWPVLISAFITGGIAFYARRYQDVPLVKPFRVLMWLVMAWALLYALGISVVILPLKIFIVNITYIPSVLTTLASFALALEYTGRGQWLTRRRLVALLVTPVIFLLLAFTSEWHQLWRFDYQLHWSGLVPVILATKGWVYWLYVAYMTGLSAATFIIFITAFQVRSLRFRNTLVLMLGMLFPVVVGLLYVFDLLPVRGFDWIPTSFIGMGLFYAWALLRFQLFDVMPVTRNTIMDNMEGLVIVLDMRGHIVDFNRAAERALALSPATIGAAPNTLPQPWADLFARHADTFDFKDAITLNFEASPRIYDLTISPILDKQDRTLGRLFLFYNITERMRAERALRQSEERYHHLIEMLPDGIVTYRNGEILFVNPASMTLLGATSPDEMVGRNVLDFIHPDSLEIVRQRQQQIKEMKPELPLVDEKFMRLDGKTIDVEIVSRLMEMDGDTITLSVFRDITERKRAERAIQESEAKYRFLTESIKDVVWTLDTETMRFTYVSPSVLSLRGYTPEEVLAEPFSASVMPQAVDSLKQIIRQRAADFLSGKERPDKFFTGEAEQPCKDGSTVWTEVIMNYYLNEKSGHVDMHGVTRDITKRRQSEERIRQLSRAVEQSPASIVITNTSGTIEYVNQRFAQVTGYSFEEAIGKNPNILKSDKTPVGTHRQLWEAITAGREWQGEFVNQKKNGELYYESALISPITDGQGVITHYLAVKEDITERKRSEEQMLEVSRKLQLQLEEIQLLQAELREQAIRDPLTGLYNRRYLNETLEREIARALREKYPISFVMIDIDHFKKINDSLGHASGDVVLQKLAAQLLGQTRVVDIVCRYGGEEFLVILPNVMAEIAFQIAERWRRSFMGLTLPLDYTVDRVTISSGISEYPENGKSGEELISMADKAMYHAKKMGRNKVVIWRDDLSE